MSYKIVFLNVFFSDIASTSVEQSKERYRQIKEKENPRYPTFDAEFMALDCSKVW